MVRSWSSFGMLPCAMKSSIAGCRWASSLRRLTVRTGSASASAMACSFQPCASSVSVARQMSTLVIEARIRFSDTDRMASCGFVGVARPDVDRGEAGGDRGLDAAVAGDDDQVAVHLPHDAAAG